MLKAFRGETTYEEVLRVTAADGGPVESRCTGCGAGVAPGMVCCPWCGTSADSGHCASCAKPLESNWRICPWCRNPKGNASASAAAAAGRPALPLSG
jgi:type IV pilus assembly protein PilB